MLDNFQGSFEDREYVKRLLQKEFRFIETSSIEEERESSSEDKAVGIMKFVESSGEEDN